MRTFHFYDVVTGLFTGNSLSLSGSRLEVLRRNTPEGCKAYEGAVDYLSQRVDVETDALIDYQPPAPDSNYEWNPQVKRWLKRAEVVADEQRKADVMAEIESLEKLQLRSISELYSDPNSRAARDHFDRRKARIDELRASLSDETGSTSP